MVSPAEDNGIELRIERDPCEKFGLTMDSTLSDASRLAGTIGLLVRLSCRWFWAVILLCLLASALAFHFVAGHIAIDTDSDKLFRADLPFRKNQAAIDQAFPQRNDLIAVVIDGATPELAEQAGAKLAEKLQAQGELFRSVRRPDAGPFFERNGLLFSSPDEVSKITQQLIKAEPMLGSLAADPSLRGLMNTLKRLLDGIAHGDAKLADIDRPLAALADSLAGVAAGKDRPFSWQAMISGDKPGTRTLRRFILVQPRLSYGKLEPGGDATAAIRNAAKDLGLTPDHGVRVRLTGSVPLADEEFATLAQGALRNAILTMLAVVGLLWLCLRSARIIIAILITLLVGLLFSAAFGVAAVGPFNLISIAFAVLFVGLGVDLGIQFSIRYRAERHQRDDLEGALVAAGKSVGSSLALAAASIAAGFYAFLPTDYRGVSELGLIAGSGMLIAFLLSITLLPALLTLLKPPGEPAPIGFAALAPADRFLARHRRAALAVAGLVALGCLALLPALRFDFNPLNLRSPQGRVGLDLVRPDEGPERNAEYGRDPGPFAGRRPEARRAGSAALPEVAADRDLGELRAQGPGPEARPHRRRGPALEPRPRSPFGEAGAERRRDRPRHDQDGGRAAQRGGRRRAARGRRCPQARRRPHGPGRGTGRQPAKGRGGADPRARDHSRPAAPGAPGRAGDLAVAAGRPGPRLDDARRPSPGRGLSRRQPERQRDPGPLRRRGAPQSRRTPRARRFRSRNRAAPWSAPSSRRERWRWSPSACCCCSCCAASRDTLLTLAPLFLAGLLTLGLSVLIGLPLNFANIIALPLLFGIGVAFNIYFVMAWRRGASDFLQSSLTRAILFSALTTTAAFGSLCFSNHPGTASMGLLLALSLGCTLVSALLFLPALLGPPRSLAGQ